MIHMDLNSTKNRIIFTIILLFFIGIIFFLAPFLDQRSVVVPVPASVYSGVVSSSTPTRIIIPNLGIDAAVLSVGKTEGGNMAVPERFEDVGWYKYGPTPGQIGNSVLAGHLDDGKGKPAVFHNLRDINIGDEIIVENANGEKVIFVVKEIRLVDYLNPPLLDIFGQSSESRLNLITCDGIWIPEKKMYSERLVVFTERVVGY